MAACHHILVRVLGAFDFTDHIIVFHRPHTEMVADIEFKEEGTAFLYHLLDGRILVLVQLDVADVRQIVEGESRVVHDCPVIERSERNCRRLDKA